MTARKRRPPPSPAKAAKPAAKKAAAGHGGARKGAGRPRAGIPESVLADLGPEPIDPLDAPLWFRRAIYLVQRGVMQGEPWKDMLRDLQKSAKVSRELATAEMQAELARGRLRPTTGEADAAGAEPTPRSSDPLATRRDR